MRIGLVSTHTHPFAIGLRSVCATLKAAGHDVVMLFMSSRRDTARPDYSPAALAQFVDVLRDCGLIGMSLLTNTFHRAGALLEAIRAAGLSAPVVWGGTHPTVAPEECLPLADAVCIGEGEQAMLELADRLAAGRDPTGVPNLWYRVGGALSPTREIRNPLALLRTNLDELPFPDYDLDTHWVAQPDGLARATPRNLRGALDVARVITARGCPYHCTFCNNTALREIHRGQGPWVRLRSVDHVLGELRQLKARFPTIHAVNFVDDLFLVRSEEELERFAERYARDIGWPLELDVFPNTVTERKLAALRRVPLRLVSMGIESGSADTLENLYRRPTPPARIAAAIETLARHRVPTEYHYIVSNPYEPEANVIETLRFIADHHRGPARLRVFPLMFYPGTPLHARAVAEGRIRGRDHAAYDYMGSGALELARHDYLAVWLRIVLNLRNIGVPRWVCHRIIDFAIARPVRAVLDRRWFCPTVFFGYQAARKIWRNFVYQPFVRPLKYLRRPRAAASAWRGARRGPASRSAAWTRARSTRSTS